MPDALGRTAPRPRDRSQDARGQAIDDLSEAMLWRDTLLRAVALVATYDEQEAAALNGSVVQADAAVRTAAAAVASTYAGDPVASIANPITMLSGAAVYLLRAGQIVGVVDLAAVLAARTDLPADADEVQVTVGVTAHSVLSNGSVRVFATGQVITGAERDGQQATSRTDFEAVPAP